MDVKDAIATAKAYIEQIYAGSEPISEVSLEEVEFDGSTDQWLITVEFSRQVNGGVRTRARELLEKMGEMPPPRRRVQKIVVVSDRDRSAVAMRNREAA